ncbi:alpha/beta fold hydrolase [Haloferax sp. MBLA0076]|uniref:Alpha/beta fold hydrolase n=1 Tax=Haloferax litoreum TaxID=2666140 RepID=A0A6A8GHT5_9EURY|nr:MULTISPECIES: alpha/beta hydrolase [Haloferax]KAB1193837.1 alpha/beta hydrolase [Haloferax sp. CBA1148]MRX22381.1 alpha/beta fold hydrolase [Haloferax litoreum]
MDVLTTAHHGRTTTYRFREARGEPDAPTILFVHGSGGSHSVWRGQFRLASDYSVAALDLSGHGDSDDVDADTGYETLSAYVDDVIAVAKATDASVLVGNSLGGAVAMTLALERDYDLDALVLAGTGAKLAVLDDLLNWLDDDFDRAVSFLHEEDKLFHTDDERLVEGSKEAMYDAGRAVTRRDFRSCHTFDVRDQLGEISVPTLALVGEYDRLTPPSYHEFLSEEIPNGEMATIEDAAHLAMLEQPEAFNAAVTSFLDRRVE